MKEEAMKEEAEERTEEEAGGQSPVELSLPGGCCASAWPWPPRLPQGLTGQAR